MADSVKTVSGANVLYLPADHFEVMAEADRIIASLTPPRAQFSGAARINWEQDPMGTEDDMMLAVLESVVKTTNTIVSVKALYDAYLKGKGLPPNLSISHGQQTATVATG